MSTVGPSKIESWQALVEEPKSLFNWPSWSDGSMYRESRKSATEAGRLPLVSDIAARSDTLISVADENSVAIEDVRIRISVWLNRPMEDVTATFEVYDGVRWVCVSRIDFAPTAPHPNKHWRQFSLPPEVNGSHIHKCEDNAKIGADAFSPVGNLPIARPLDEEPRSFRDICAQVGTHFNVADLENLEPPPWNWSLQYDR